MSNLQNYQTFRRWSVDQLNRTYSQSASVLIHAVLPYKNVDYYLRYFSTCTKLSVQKDANLIAQFKIFFFLLVYWALLNTVFYFFSLSSLVQIALIDGVFIFQIGQQFYLFYISLICYSIHLQWALYVKSNYKLNLIIKNALVGEDDNLPADVKFVRCETIAKQTKYRRLVIAFNNAMQSFILF